MRRRNSEKDGWQLNQSHWNFFRITDLHPIKAVAGERVLTQRTPMAHPAGVFHSDQTGVPWLLNTL